MAANFIELQEENQEDSITTLDQQDSTTPVPTKEMVGQTEEVAEVPEKYKGKSPQEIIHMHQEAEKLIGRQAQEVGEVRKLADSLLRQQLETKKQETQQPSTVPDIDWYDDPAKAVNQAVENNPVLKRLQEEQAKQVQLTALQTIEKAHPDYISVAQTEDFQKWIGNSRIRQQLYTSASNYDVDSALELLDTYKSLRNMKQQKEDLSKAADETLKKADDENRGKALKAAAVQQGGTGESTKPIYRRQDLIRLRMQDPDRYESMADDILQAYAEQRVR